MAEVFIHSKWDQHAHMDHIDAVQNMVKMDFILIFKCHFLLLHLWKLLRFFLQFKCCGYFGPDEYLNSTNTEDHHDMLPSSCCGSNGYNYCLIEFAYEKGCKEKFLDALEENFGIIIGVAVGFAVFEVSNIDAMDICSIFNFTFSTFFFLSHLQTDHWHCLFVRIIQENPQNILILTHGLIIQCNQHLYSHWIYNLTFSIDEFQTWIFPKCYILDEFMRKHLRRTFGFLY